MTLKECMEPGKNWKNQEFERGERSIIYTLQRLHRMNVWITRGIDLIAGPVSSRIVSVF